MNALDLFNQNSPREPLHVEVPQTRESVASFSLIEYDRMIHWQQPVVFKKNTIANQMAEAFGSRDHIKYEFCNCFNANPVWCWSYLAEEGSPWRRLNQRSARAYLLYIITRCRDFMMRMLHFRWPPVLFSGQKVSYAKYVVSGRFLSVLRWLVDAEQSVRRFVLGTPNFQMESRDHEISSSRWPGVLWSC